MGTADPNAAKAAAFDEIVKIVAHYLPPDSGVLPEEVVSDIIGLIEIRGLYRFLELDVGSKT